MPKKYEQKTNYLKKSRTDFLRRNAFSIIFLSIGAIILCLFLTIIQSVSAERNQSKNSNRILQEVEQTLTTNDEIISDVFYEYNEINQTTLSTLSSYLEYIIIENDSLATDNDKAEETSRQITKMCNEMKIDAMMIVDSSFNVMVSNLNTYIGVNIKNDTDKNIQRYSATSIDSLIGYSVDEKGVVIKNGTYEYKDNKKIYSPIFLKLNDVNLYVYSSKFATINGDDYYVLTFVPSTIIDEELAGLKSISHVLSGITVGKNGFLFALEKANGTYLYFDDGNDTILTNNYYNQSEVLPIINNDTYAGYLEINGVRYYCVSKNFQSESYGQFTVIAAVVSQSEILNKNIISVVFSCVAFILVSLIVAGYGMILRRDLAEHLLSVEEKCKSNLRDDNKSHFNKLTEEEINERTKIFVDEEIEKNVLDKRLRRRNIGVRNSKGKQSYFSIYIFSKMISVVFVGFVAIFIITFFSQTLIGLNDATSVSSKRLTEVVDKIDSNKKTSESIEKYVDEQFLSKARLISYILEENPQILFINNNDSNIHDFVERDENGNQVHVGYDEYPSSKRVAISNSNVLQRFCEENDISSVYVYASDGRVIATNTSGWYINISKNSNDPSYKFNDIIDDKVESLIVNDDESMSESNIIKYIGTAFFYYTYLDNNGTVCFASKSMYEDYLNGDTSLGDIIKHRSVIKIGVNENAVKELFGTTEISYILSNTLVYGENSFFIAFDTSDEHKVVYSPLEAMIGKNASSIGVLDSAFTLNGTYNGFQTVNGIKYYQSIELLGDYYLATAIPTTNIYESRNAISLYTLLFSSLFIILASAFYTISSDVADKDYCNSIRYSDLDNNSDTFFITTASGKVSKTKAVAARFSKQSWRKKTPEEKLGTILMIYMTIASFLIVLAILFAIRNKNSDSIFTYIFSGVWERGLNIFAVCESIMIMIILITITLLAQICVRSFCGSLGARVETTGNLIVSVLRYGSVIGGLFYCLYLFGFNTGSLLASAGILSIVIGLGAQSLISDIIAGIFIVFEGAFRVGDIVTIGDFRGQVLEIGLRTTKIEDISKNIKIFNNSAISGVLNMTKEASYAAIDVSIEYGEDLERVEKILIDAFPKIRKKLSTITDGPFYKGVSELADSSVNLKITAQCLEKDRLQLARDLNREIFLLFNKHDINIPFPQVTLSSLEKKEEKEEKHDSHNNQNVDNKEE